jgi:hypothetical protein
MFEELREAIRQRCGLVVEISHALNRRMLIVLEPDSTTTEVPYVDVAHSVEELTTVFERTRGTTLEQREALRQRSEEVG